MKIVQINSVCGNGSTGKICVAISEMLTNQGIENCIFYAIGSSKYKLGIKYMSAFDLKFQTLKSKLIGNYGFQSKRATKKLISKIESISPDIVHLHNLHSHNIHLGIFFSYLKKKSIKVVWTFHDCWAITGYCTHFCLANCDKWEKGGCQKCVQRKKFSWFFDKSVMNYYNKKSVFSNLDLTIVAPSNWLASQVKRSFLQKYNIRVIYNGIDLSVFYPIENKLKVAYNIEDKYIVLGVSFEWNFRKGLDIFIELSKKLDDRFKIVLVGTNSQIDKLLPNNIISIHKTIDSKELAQIYSSADVFVNPTREEVLGLVNIEANACGLPVVTFDTGGSPECIDETSGIVVPQNNIFELEKAIKKICLTSHFSKTNCVAKASLFDQNIQYKKYIDLYNELERGFKQ